MQAADLSQLACVLEDEDLWAHVLSFLPLKTLYVVSTTSSFHRSLMRASRAHVKNLRIGMKEGWPAPRSTAGFNDAAQPAFFIEEYPARTRDHHWHVVVISKLQVQSVRLTSNSLHHRHLVRICSCYPSLACLHIDVSPMKMLKMDAEVTAKWVCGTERLIDIVSWMSRSAIQMKSDKRCGPHPWCLLGTPTVETLRIVATFDTQLQPDPEENEETCYRIRPLMAMCAVSCARSLRSLDLTGVGPGVMAALLQQELPLLRVLRLGAASSRNGFGWEYERSQLGSVGKAFPGLTALDVGYASFVDGVSSADVDTLVTHCKGMQHLDLSMVMSYMDFGPALRILAQKAPNLRSLATHGLVLPMHALLELAAGCPLLERAHLVRWMGDDPGELVPPDDLLAVLRACTNLVHLDLSCGLAPQEQLLAWLEERQQSGRPVHSLVVHGCFLTLDPDQAQQWQDAEEMALQEALKAKALAISPSLHVSTGIEAGCEWSQESEDIETEELRSWLQPRQRMFDAIGL